MIEFVGEVFEVVVGLVDVGGVEGIGFDQVCVGFQVGGMYVVDDVWLGQCEQVVVVFQVVGVGVIVCMCVVVVVSEVFVMEG